MSHNLKMILGCLLPLLLIFILPVFGVSEGITLLVFIIIMFGCHLFMMGGHGGHDENFKREDSRKGGGHAHT